MRTNIINIKKLTAIATLGAISLSPAFAGDWLAKQMFTLAPTIQIYGPVKGTLSSDQYQTKIFRIILEEGHEKAREYLQVGDFEAYWAFIIASLTVPLHEGSNLHFRKVENNGTKCQERSNSGQIFSNSAKYTAVFKRIFKQTTPPALPECDEVSNDQYLYQLLHGADGSDLGIMQVNLYWHERNYLAGGDWKSVRKTIRYGLGLLKNGFSGVYRNSNRYSCVQSASGVNYDNLIRASWAGVYNSGNLGASCRFANPNSDWARNDNNFKNSLNKIKSLDDDSQRSRHYKMESREDDLLKSIVEHYKEKTNDSKILTDYLLLARVAGTDQAQPRLDSNGPVVVVDPVEPVNPTEPDQTEHPPKPPVVVPVNRQEINPVRLYAVTANLLNFRDGPGTSFNDCGGLPKKTEVIVKAMQGDWLELVKDEMLASYYEPGNKCNSGARFAHKGFLADKGPLYDDPEVIPDPALPIAVATPAPRPTPTVVVTENRTYGRAKGWAKVREDRPQGYTMAPATGQVIGPAGQEVIVAEIIWNSSNSKYPWYRLTAPVQGWVYGQYITVEE